MEIILVQLITGVREMIKGVIAEDNLPFRNKLVQIITSFDIEIEYCTENAEDLLKVIDKINPGIVFLDIGLPGLSGIEAAKRWVISFPKMTLSFQN
jgi:DNA-binding LytR/AlgR family response regulator